MHCRFALPYSNRFNKNLIKARSLTKYGAEQLERNRINAQKYLRRKVNANFGVGDLFFSLDYKGAEPSVQEARRIFKNFIERLRYYCKTHKMSLKYIAVTENTQSRDGRIHHHVVMNKPVSYTHLDVYKRQVILHTPTFCPSVPLNIF